MAAISGNKVTVATGKQTAKGTAQNTPTYKQKLTGGDFAPRREVIELAETDGSRQQSANIVVAARVEGNPEHYLRPDSFVLDAYALLGAISTTGATSPFTHTVTPADSGPYFTKFKAIGGTVLVDKYVDCRPTSMRVRGQAGGALMYSMDWVGLDAIFGAADPGSPSPESQNPFVYPQVTVTKGGSAPGTIESFELTIANNGDTIQGDKQLQPYDYVWGELQVSGTMTILFENDSDYRKFHTGSASGTGFTQTLFTESLTIKAAVSSSLSVEFTMLSVAYTEYPVAPDPGGAPIRVALGFRSQPQAAIADYIKIVGVNSVSSY